MNTEIVSISQTPHDVDPTESAQALFYVFPRRRPDVPESEPLQIPNLFLAVDMDGEIGMTPSIPLRKTPSMLWKLDDVFKIPSQSKSIALRLYLKEIGKEYFVLADAILNEIEFPPPREDKVIQLDFAAVGSYPRLGTITAIIAIFNDGQYERVSEKIEGNMTKMNDKNFMLTNVIASPPHPLKLGALQYLGNEFCDAFLETQYEQDIGKSILAYETAASLVPPEDPEFLGIMCSLAYSCILDWEKFGNANSLNRAISSLDAAIGTILSDTRKKCNMQTSLADCLVCRFEHSRQDSDLEWAISLQNQVIENTPDSNLEKANLSNNLAKLWLARLRSTKDLKYAEFAVAAQRDAVRLGRQENPDLLKFYPNLNIGEIFQARFDISRDINDINGAIVAYQQTLSSIETTPSETQTQWSIQHRLSDCLLDRFYHTDQSDDLERAILLQQQALEIIPDDNPEKPKHFNNLAINTLTCFRKTRDLKYADYALMAQRSAIRLTTDKSLLPAFFGAVGEIFRARFKVSDDVNDINGAIVAYREVVSLVEAREGSLNNSCGENQRDVWDGLTIDSWVDTTGFMGEARIMTYLGFSLLRRWETSNNGDARDIQDAILWLQKSLDVIRSSGHPPRPETVGYMGKSLLHRYHRFGEVKDVDEAIATFRNGITFIRKDNDMLMSGQLAWLANSLKFRFERTGTASDIDDAIEAIRSSIEKTPEVIDEENSSHFDILGNILLRRFLVSGNPQDLNDSITACESAIKLTSENVAGEVMGARFSHLGNSLLRRFELIGSQDDIDQAISVQQNAVQLTSDLHHEANINYNNLGNAFLRRYTFRNERKDLEEAIFAFRKTVELSAHDSSALPEFLDNLSTAIRIRGTLNRNTADLDEAISIQQRASSLLPPGHAKAPVLLSNRGRIYLQRFSFSNDRDDLNQAISILRKALDALPEQHIAKAMGIETHASAHVELYLITHDLDTLDSAITLYSESIKTTPLGHSDLASRRLSLARAFRLRFEHDDDVEHRESAMSEYRRAALDTHGIPSARLDAAHDMAMFALDFDSVRSFEGYRYALNLLQGVAWLGASITERHANLRKFSGIPIEAASVALSLGEFNIALRWLEYGRCVVWSQLTRLRTPLDHLREVSPELADELMMVSVLLDKSSTQISEWNSDNTIGRKILFEDESRARHQLSKQWDTLLERVRTMEDFEDFLQAPEVSELMDLGTASGPVVVINMHPFRCDALVLVSATEGCVHVPLVKFSYKRANILRQTLATCLGSRGLRTRENRMGRKAVDKSTNNADALTKLLAELWICVVKPILEALSYSPSGTPLRIWWCPTGPLAFLPIHAAGIYGQNMPFGSTISDYVVSSYTPSVSALLVGRQRKKDKEFGGILGVSQPNAPNLAPIPNTTKEVEGIRHEFGQAGLTFELLEGSAATVESVLVQMETRNWIHFACHALQNVYEPTKSAFYLHDGPLELSTIIKKPLRQADFAFLSACQTGTGDENLSEEAVHLAAGMVSAGYRSVIATMWSIDDQYCPKIAQEVYSYLLQNMEHGPDSTMAAHALHHATQHLRRKLGDSEESLLSWVPFIHIGV